MRVAVALVLVAAVVAGTLNLIAPVAFGDLNGLVLVQDDAVAPDYVEGQVVLVRTDGAYDEGDIVVFPFGGDTAIGRVEEGGPRSGYAIRADGEALPYPVRPTADAITGRVVLGLPRWLSFVVAIVAAVPTWLLIVALVPLLVLWSPSQLRRRQEVARARDAFGTSAWEDAMAALRAYTAARVLDLEEDVDASPEWPAGDEAADDEDGLWARTDAWWRRRTRRVVVDGVPVPADEYFRARPDGAEPDEDLDDELAVEGVRVVESPRPTVDADEARDDVAPAAGAVVADDVAADDLVEEVEDEAPAEPVAAVDEPVVVADPEVLEVDEFVRVIEVDELDERVEVVDEDAVEARDLTDEVVEDATSDTGAPDVAPTVVEDVAESVPDDEPAAAAPAAVTPVDEAVVAEQAVAEPAVAEPAVAEPAVVDEVVDEPVVVTRRPEDDVVVVVDDDLAVAARASTADARLDVPVADELLLDPVSVATSGPVVPSNDPPRLLSGALTVLMLLLSAVAGFYALGRLGSEGDTITTVSGLEVGVGPAVTAAALTSLGLLVLAGVVFWYGFLRTPWDRYATLYWWLIAEIPSEATLDGRHRELETIQQLITVAQKERRTVLHQRRPDGTHRWLVQTPDVVLSHTLVPARPGDEKQPVPSDVGVLVGRDERSGMLIRHVTDLDEFVDAYAGHDDVDVSEEVLDDGTSRLSVVVGDLVLVHDVVEGRDGADDHDDRAVVHSAASDEQS